MKKGLKAIIIAVATIFVFVLASCSGVRSTGSSTNINLIRTTTDTSISLEYDYVNGKHTYYMKNKNDEKLAMRVETESVKGDLVITIGKVDGDAVYEGTLNKDSVAPTFTVYLPEKGEYYIEMQFKNHEGKVYIDWSK